MKRLAFAATIAVLLLPGVARAGGATDAALGLGAFAVLNQIIAGTGIFSGAAAVAAPAPVYAPTPVYAAPPPPVYYAPPPVYYAPQPVYYGPPPVYYAPPPVYVAPPPAVYYPAPRYHGRRAVHVERERHWRRHDRNDD
jgi:hypothetical protein